MASPLSKEQAHDRVMKLRDLMFESYRAEVESAPFLTELRAGTLPKESLALFYQNWAQFVLTINTLALQVYAKEIHYLKRHWDLMELFAGKISDEFGYPEPPGHIRVLLTSGHALGLTDDQMLLEPAMPSARALADFHKVVVTDGALADYWASVLWEEAMGPWCVDWMKALTTHYGVAKDEIIYFSAHYEADVAEHEGRAAHSSVVQTVLERMLMDGVADELSGFGLEYCAVTPVKLLGQMHQACMPRNVRV
jgi:pyrroloquinoline quinone (PQQ) biosynthesis protein C